MLLFKKIDEITDGQWFLSGSRGTNTYTKESDWDICIPVWWKEKIKEYFNGHPAVTNFKLSDYYKGFIISVNVENENFPKNNRMMDLNFIPLHPREFLAWAMTTKQLLQQTEDLEGVYSKLLNKPARILAKTERIADFEASNAMNKRHIPDFEYSQRLPIMKSVWMGLQDISDVVMVDVPRQQIEDL
jgi:predicted nucleotidyltransferase